MKKLISVLALAALVCGAAFADVTVTDWYGYAGDESKILITEYEPIGFAAELPYGEEADYFDFETFNVSGWLYNANEPINVTLEDFGDNDFTASENSNLELYFNGYDCTLVLGVPWAGNGTYTFTGADILEEYSSGSLDGKNVNYFGVYGWNYDADDYVAFNPGGSGKVTITFGARPVVPEPCTIAYALTGLGFIAGIKRRFKK